MGDASVQHNGACVQECLGREVYLRALKAMERFIMLQTQSRLRYALAATVAVHAVLLLPASSG